MSNETRVDNPLAGMFKFYVDLSEQMAPVVKQGIEDWFTVYTKLWTETLKMQGDFLGQVTGMKRSADFTNQAKDFGEKVMETQKNVSTDVVDTTLKGVRSFKAAAKRVKDLNQ